MQIKDTTLSSPEVFAALVQWTHAGDVDCVRLLAALKEAEVPEHLWPKEPSEHVVLGRALRECAGREDRVEPIRDGWCLTMVNREKLDLEDPSNTGHDAHQVCVTAKVMLVGDAKVVRVTPEDSPHAALIQHEYERARTLFKASEDLSRWLSQTVVPWVGGVAAKARGGSYYVMKGVGLERIKAIKAALDSVSTVTWQEFKLTGQGETETFKLPTVLNGTAVVLKPEFAGLDAVRLMLNGLIEECDDTCDALATKLNGSLGERALNTQIDIAVQLETKLQNYSTALGIDLGDMVSRLSELKGGLGIALANKIQL